ncbi:unnamed protein product [Caenorhabditis bovis]|uniref:Uncharacterized protein n=1 Tax=Caenorhabditis bovis TaxID=2654633 RepID=A0A8S1EQA7_9PELO|nr:unnamed protein product [Caenorhabditis bovis]
METANTMRMRELGERMSNDADLSTIHLDVLTPNGHESVVLEFPNADKRSVWEAAFKETKNALVKHQMSTPSCQLKNIVAHQTRPGLQLCTAAVVPGKRADSLPFVWVCASDKFSGQVAVMSLENGEASIESSSGIGNAAVTAMCTVPPPTKWRKRKMKSQRSSETFQKNYIMEMSSSGSDSESSSDDGNSGGQATVWIGNDDGEVFVVNSTERVRPRTRDRMARLRNSVTSICSSNGCVFVATSYSSQIQLLMFRATADGNWDLDNPTNVAHMLSSPIAAMAAVGRRLILASANSLHAFHTDFTGWQAPSEVLPPSDVITIMATSGAHLFVSGRKSTIVYVVDLFTLQVVNHFNVAPFVRSQLTGREDILREHKMGCLRVSCLTVARSHLWIGTSAGFVLSTSIISARTQPTPDLNVCDIGHSGPCRILLPVMTPSQCPAAGYRKPKKSSLNVPIHQSSQLLIVSCGEGLDDQSATQDPSTDAVNHLIFWKCS